MGNNRTLGIQKPRICSELRGWVGGGENHIFPSRELEAHGSGFPLGNNMQMGTKGTCFSLGNTKKQLPQANAPPPHPPKQFVSGDTGNQFPWETVGNWRHRE